MRQYINQSFFPFMKYQTIRFYFEFNCNINKDDFEICVDIVELNNFEYTKHLVKRMQFTREDQIYEEYYDTILNFNLLVHVENANIERLCITFDNYSLDIDIRKCKKYDNFLIIPFVENDDDINGINFSSIYQVHAKFNLSSVRNDGETYIYVYGITYNEIVMMNGMCALRFSS